MSKRPTSDNTTWDPKPPPDPVVVGDLVDSVLGAIAQGRPGAVLTLRSKWRDIAGVKHADKCAPVSLDDGVLIVEVTDGATASLLKYEVADIVRRAADVSAEPVSTVRFRVKRR